jgi:hypothetical protein
MKTVILAACTLAVLVITAAALQLGQTPNTTPPPPPPQIDPEITQLFQPHTTTDNEGLICMPIMNVLHWGGCPMVIV